MDFPNCTEETRKRKITIKDPRSKNSKSEVLLENPQGITIKIVEIDGCVIQGNQQMRCDRLVIVPHQKLIFIELKGKKIEQAFKQIIATLEYIYQACSSTQNHDITGIIACTGCKLARTDIQNLKAKFRKHGQLVIKSGLVSHYL
ncbi:hypothetical protein VB712_19100 [Spirulina sp. CCNP1310]|uniref:hypothetical protein n=1 Tax=Spirulina sp. CCNP1310 TaxID=3110249 RepID=UPI002B1EC2A9|nr:hypothetical protein [Spirulina sp. CCNP1310]MEA5421337.1 hypothetical protein [Spirulina sp. CCNP1310]